MSINSRDDLGTPMLNIACRNDNFEFVEMIYDLGAEINAVLCKLEVGFGRLWRLLLLCGLLLGTGCRLVAAVALCKGIAENQAGSDTKNQ